MDVKIKSLLVLLAAIIIGIAIGFEISEIAYKKRFDEMRNFKQHKGFNESFLDVIKPDAKQKPLIDSILSKYKIKIDLIRDKGMEQAGNLIDTMFIELSKNVTPEQKKSLDAEIKKIKSFPKHGKDGGPNPDGPGGPGEHGPHEGFPPPPPPEK